MLKACDGGTYGDNCILTCGNCEESEQCHHIDGTCMNGCDSGYQSVKCNQGITI